MKKQIIVGMVAVMALALYGCGESSEKTITGDVQNIVTENNANIESVEVESKANTVVEENDEDLPYVFEYAGATIEIDGEAQGYIDKMGEPISYYEASSCAFGDLDKIYTYSGFEMDTYQLEGCDYVSAIILQNDSISTPEGLSIGDESGKIEEIYGEPASNDEGTYLYIRDNMKLCIIVEKEKVASIQYLSTVLD
jgi:hypothetical protein